MTMSSIRAERHDLGANCYECSLYGSRQDPVVISFCHSCLQVPGRRRYCLTFEGEDCVLRPVGMSSGNEARRAANGKLWLLLEWNDTRRAYVPIG